jgi:hypothetical protein
MKTGIIKSNAIYIAIVAAIVGYYSYAAFDGLAFWESNDVQRNAGYNGPVAHSGYGVRFYHK